MRQYNGPFLQQSETLYLTAKDVLNLVHRRVMDRSRYFGVPARRNPLDAWVYQEMICELRPDVIIEIGSYRGAGTLQFAHLLDVLGHGIVIGIDKNQTLTADVVRAHPRVTLLEGDACRLIDTVIRLIPLRSRCLIVEDSSHTYENTLNVLRTFSPLVSHGSYFVVEDGVGGGHGLSLGPRPGVYEAIDTFLMEDGSFVPDRSRESFFLTWNPSGYLKRVSGGRSYYKPPRVQRRFPSAGDVVRAVTPPVLLQAAVRFRRRMKTRVRRHRRGEEGRGE
ncbi:MAG: class I SAM-dependent methyltransferase [Candidatus Eisenbacteria sp.]|nr:class I SAM-dependent methyltransferase [Candidatus Eisenbacteria bacterium]